MNAARMPERLTTGADLLTAGVRRSTDFRAIAVNASWLIGDKLARLGLGFFIGVWVARHLGPGQYGVLASAIAFLAIFQALSTLGLDSIVVRHVAQAPTTAHLVLGSALTLRLIASALSLFVAAVVGAVVYDDHPETLVVLLLVAAGILFQPADVVDLWFQSRSQCRRTVLAKALAYVSVAAVKVVLILGNAPLYAFAAAQSLELAISALALTVSYRRFKASALWTWHGSTAKTILIQSLPMLLSGLSIVVYMKGSQLFVSQMLDARAVGLYSTAQLLSELWYFLPMVIVTSVAPTIARRKIAAQPDYTRALEGVLGLLWLLSITIASLVALNASRIVALLFGTAYEGAGDVLAIHVFTLIPVSIGVAQTLWLINENKARLAVYQAIAGAVSSLSLNYVLVPAFGMKGGAMAVLASQCIQAFGVNLLLCPELFALQIRSLLFAITAPLSRVTAALVRAIRS